MFLSAGRDVIFLEILTVSLHSSKILYIIIPTTEIAQSDWLLTEQHFVVLVSNDIICLHYCLGENITFMQRNNRLNLSTCPSWIVHQIC